MHIKVYKGGHKPTFAGVVVVVILVVPTVN